MVAVHAAHALAAAPAHSLAAAPVHALVAAHALAGDAPVVVPPLSASRSAGGEAEAVASQA